MRVPSAVRDELLSTLAKPDHVLAQVPELSDRIIAATSFHLGAPMITRDSRLRTANLQAIW